MKRIGHWPHANQCGAPSSCTCRSAEDPYASLRAPEHLRYAPCIPLEQSIRGALDYRRDRAHMEVD